MDYDLENQPATQQMEAGIPADSDNLDPPHQTKHKHPAAGSCWKSCFCSFYRIILTLLKAVCYTIVIAVVIAILVSFTLALLALVVAVTAALTALSGALSAVSLALLFAFPVLIPLIYIIILSLPKKVVTRMMGVDDDSGGNSSSEEGMGEKYKQSRHQETLWGRIMFSSLGMLARASLVMVALLALSIWVPKLRRLTLLGSPLWKWSLLGVTLTAGYFEALTLILFLLILPVMVCNKETASYYLTRMLMSMNLVAYFGVVMVSWVAYFRTDSGLKQASTPRPQAFEYVTWTLVSLFVGSVLFLFKALLLARWSAIAIFRRFQPRILITSVKYFFIGLAAAGFFQGGIIDDLEVLGEYGVEQQQTSTNQKKRSVAKYIMSRKMGLSHLNDVSRYLMSLAEISSSLIDRDEEEDGVHPDVQWIEDKIQGHAQECKVDDLLKLFQPAMATSSPKGLPKLYETMRTFYTKTSPLAKLQELRKNIQKEANPAAKSASTPEGAESADDSASPKGIWKSTDRLWIQLAGRKPTKEEERKMACVLGQLVREECCSSQDHFTYDDFKIWMVDAHKDCINMGRTLADAKAIVTRLDLFISCVIFVIVLLLWLLITGVASTAVLVTIATPILALTFIFGDTAKTFFQGLIFCFATHPFDVGDRCILDETELEVKSVNILTTTFNKIGSKEKRMYANSELVGKAIVNLGWQPDPKDVVELTVGSSTDLNQLKNKIEAYLRRENTRFKSSYKLIVKEVGENTKLTVQFTHVLTVHDLSHSQCFVKKSGQRSDFLMEIKQYVNAKDENNPAPSASEHLKSEIVEQTQMGNDPL